MPIVDLQRRMRQLGEIRIGHVVDTGRTSEKTGRPIMRPAKLNQFRITSPSRPLLERVAELYGGDVQEWTPANGGPSEFEVYTKADRLPVIIPPQSISQWYELFAGSKCVRRCDGVTEQKTDRPCLCDPDERECKPTTRLNVMLRDLEAVGQWLLTSRGYHAAVELPAYADLLAQAGGYVEGWLSIEERRVVLANGDTARFMVPVLEAAVSPRQLLAGGSPPPGQAALTAGPKALEAAQAPDYVAAARTAGTVVAVREQWQQALSAGHLTDALKSELTEVANEVTSQGRPDQAASTSQSVPDSEDALWSAIVAASPFDTMDQLEDDFAKNSGGVMPGSASTAELRAYLELLQARAEVPA